MTGEGMVFGTGEQAEATPDRQLAAQRKLDDKLAYHEKAETHLWVVILTHEAGPSFLDNQDGTSTEPALLDLDSLVGLPVIGCYICEATYRPQLRRRKCPGEGKGADL